MYVCVSRRTGRERKGEGKGKERKGKERKGKERKGKERMGEEWEMGEEKLWASVYLSIYLFSYLDMGIEEERIEGEPAILYSNKQTNEQTSCSPSLT